MKSFRLVVGLVSSFFTRFFQSLLGDFSWRRPAWMSGLQNSVGQHPALFTVAVLGLVVLMVASWWAANGYEHQPKPRTVSWMISFANQPPPSPNFQAQPLTINFGQSVARLEAIGKEVKEGVVLSPKIEGRWTWWGGSQLGFMPTRDWPADTVFQIRLKRSLFSSHARIDTLQREFRTPPFTVAIQPLEFYVNPKDPATRQITATLTFSHPVDRASLEKNLQLVSSAGQKLFQKGTSASDNCTITYDMLDCVAYVRSSNVQLPAESDHAELTVPTAVSAAGGARLETAEEKEVLVPCLSDLFHVSQAQAVIVSNRQGEPEQALILETSVGVKADDLSHALHGWILPAPPHHENEQDKDVWTPGEITPAIRAQAKPVQLEALPTEQVYGTTHSFRLKVPENGWLYVEVDQGLAALGDFTLAEKFASVSRVPPYPLDVHVMHEGSLLALNGERKLSIMSRGVEELEFRLGRVTPSAINHLVSQSEGSFQSPAFTNSNFDESNITERVVRHQSIAAMDTAKSNYSALDFSEFVQDRDANRGKLGLFFLHVLARTGGDDNGYYKKDGGILPDPAKATASGEGNDPNESPDPEDNDAVLTDRRFILVTDLGLLIKDNADGTHDVFVQSIKTGQPVDGAQVEVLGKNGLPVLSGQTDDSGRVTLATLADFKREQQPVAYVVRKGQDVSFLPFGRADRELNFSRFDISGVTGLAAGDLTAFVFTDRGIYRPGDEAKLGVVVKQRDWQGKLEGVPLRLDIVDPRGTVVQSRSLTLGASGFLAAAFPSRETSATGKYQVNCYLAKGKDDETLLGSATLRVAEFLPDRLKIKATLSTPPSTGWISAANLTGRIALENLYGAVAIDHRVTGKITLNPSQFSFDRYPDYSFVDPYLNPNAPRRSHDEDLPEQKTDEAGAASFDLSMANLEPSAYQMSFLAEGFEKEGGRSVTAGAEVLVSPRAWLVGMKPDGDFNFVRLGTKRLARLIAVDAQLKPIAIDHLKMKVAERRYVSVLVQKPNGNYAYESVLKEIPAGEEEVAIPVSGRDWPLPTGEPGDFAARLYDDHGDLVADVRYSVAGSGNLTRSLEKNAELTARLSKPEYLPGEEVEVEITAPYAGAGLLTIERDKVYAHAWFQAKTTTTVQKIRLPEGFEGNGYLNVAFVRALDSKEIYMSPLSYAVLPFKVNQETRHTRMEIKVPPVALPGGPLQIEAKASRSTQAIVYAVDEGILQVAKYTLPDPLGYFFRKQALEVGTRQTVDLILPEYSIVREVAAAGGDADDDALAHHLNPFKRKRDKPVVFWSGIVELGPQAKTFTYPVPDYYAGTIRVMVVASTPDAVGSAQATTQVRGPFVISPNVPTFVAPSDTFDVSVAVANNIAGSGPNAPVQLDLTTTDDLEVVQKPESAVPIAEGRDASVHWLLRARDVLGDADLTITAQLGTSRSSLTSHLSVRPPVPYLTTLTSGSFNGTEKKVPITRQLYSEFRKVTVLASPVPQGFTRGLGDYLEHYEYGCTEQLVSKAFPTLVSSDSMPQGLSRAELAQRVQEIVDVAASRQNDQGAFGLWGLQPDLHFDLPSLHVMLFLTEAREQGYDIPGDMLIHGLGHLQQMADETAANLDQARNQACAIYLLARNGRVATNALEHNHAWLEKNAKDWWGDDVAGAYEAAAYALLKDQDQADTLIQRFHLRNASHVYQDEGDFNSALGRAAQYIYLLSRHFPERAARLKADDLTALADPIMGGDYNTLSAAQAILALDSYARATGKTMLPPDACAIDQVVGNARQKLELRPGIYAESPVGAEATALIFKKSGVPNLFYQIVESGFDHDPVTTAVSEGIEVSRDYRNQAGEVVTAAKLGEELVVTIHLRSTENQDLPNIAIEDLLPGGFEIVEESVRSGLCNDQDGMDYKDVREDRLLAFGWAYGRESTLSYRIKATNKGTYLIPPIQAESMYHLKIRARGISGTLIVD